MNNGFRAARGAAPRRLSRALWGRPGRARPLALALGILVLWFVPGPALAQNIAIDAFYGHWSGTGVSESNISLYFRLTSRDLDVSIQARGTGFVVEWTTVQRQRGNPDDPTPVRKGTAIEFVPSGMPGVWRAADAADPLSGQRYAWVRIKDQTLTVHSLVIDDEGGYEMQIYHRTLTGLGMELEFAAFRNGEARRTAKGRLVKVGD